MAASIKNEDPRERNRRAVNSAILKLFWGEAIASFGRKWLLQWSSWNAHASWKAASVARRQAEKHTISIPKLMSLEERESSRGREASEAEQGLGWGSQKPWPMGAMKTLQHALPAAT